MITWRTEELTRGSQVVLAILRDGVSVGSISLFDDSEIEMWKKMIGEANLRQTTAPRNPRGFND